MRKRLGHLMRMRSNLCGNDTTFLHQKQLWLVAKSIWTNVWVSHINCIEIKVTIHVAVTHLLSHDALLQCTVAYVNFKPIIIDTYKNYPIVMVIDFLIQFVMWSMSNVTEYVLLIFGCILSFDVGSLFVAIYVRYMFCLLHCYDCLKYSDDNTFIKA